MPAKAADKRREQLRAVLRKARFEAWPTEKLEDAIDDLYRTRRTAAKSSAKA